MNQDQFWQQFTVQCQQGQLPQAYLLVGEGLQGLGDDMAAFLFCEATDNRPCGHCKGCLLMQSDTRHPDLFVLSAEGKLNLIKIDPVRELLASLKQTALQGSVKVIMIHEAHTLNSHAANALLKSLEEPAPNTHFILFTKAAHLLLATVKSRCQMVTIDPLTVRDTVDTVALTQALMSGADPLVLSEQYKKEDLTVILNTLIYLLFDVLKQYATSPAIAQPLFQYLDRCYAWRRELDLKISINAELFLTEMLIGWSYLPIRFGSQNAHTH